MNPLEVTVVGGGMITHDQILPSLYSLQRQGVIGPIAVCALNARPLRDLARSEQFARAFPGQSFVPFPPLDTDPDAPQPDLYARVIAGHAAAQPGGGGAAGSPAFRGHHDGAGRRSERAER